MTNLPNFVPNTGQVSVSVPTGAGNTVVSALYGRLGRVLVTTAGTGSGGVLFYDNATTNSGTVIGYVPATVSVGTYYTFDMPAANGITVVNVANGPVLTVSFI
jgi:hypothetical protein